MKCKRSLYICDFCLSIRPSNQFLHPSCGMDNKYITFIGPVKHVWAIILHVFVEERVSGDGRHHLSDIKYQQLILAGSFWLFVLVVVLEVFSGPLHHHSPAGRQKHPRQTPEARCQAGSPKNLSYQMCFFSPLRIKVK